MAQGIRKFTALLFIPIFLWAGAGFSLSRHYCLGMLVEESFYFQSETCDMHRSSDSNCTDSIVIEEKDCCDDEWLQVEGIQISKTVDSETKVPIIPIEPNKTLKGSFCGQEEIIIQANFLDPSRVPLRGELNPELSQYLSEVQSYLI